MFVDIDLEPFIQAMLDHPPNPTSGFITQQDAESLQWFIAGSDSEVRDGGVPLIVEYGMTPLPATTVGQVEAALQRLETEGKVVATCRIGPNRDKQCYAWNRPDHYASFYSRRELRQLERRRRKTLKLLGDAINEGEKLLNADT